MILHRPGYFFGACVLLRAFLASVAAAPSALIELSSTWQVLGPFQIGTREAVWGADPTEAYGGFRGLSFDTNSRFPSSLAREGYVLWSEVEVKDRRIGNDSSCVAITVAFPDIDWLFLRSIYGWAATQYQAWARGNLSIADSAAESIVLYTDSILELWVDGHHYFGGDFYAYRRTPLVLQLSGGLHQIDVRLIRDVRAMGGGDDPSVTVILEAKTTLGGLNVDLDATLISDVVSGRLANDLASVTVRNEGTGWIDIMGIESVDGFAVVSLLREEPFQLAPGASRSLIFNTHLQVTNVASLSFRLIFVNNGNPERRLTLPFSSNLRQQQLFDAHKFTFLHPSGVLSYAILRPPLETSNRGSRPRSYPVLLNLHGAGLEADSEQVRHMLDASPDLSAWLLFPSGVTSWSGDDWHIWGFEDIQGAINHLPQWIVHMNWKGSNVSTSKWLVSGHSNGGQGTWYILSHYPDKLIAAAPVSGYTSIQAYVPYNMWQEASPLAMSVIQTSLSSYRHEMLLENFVGIPLLFQHGSADDNVPVFHSRRMYQLLSELRGRPKFNDLSAAQSFDHIDLGLQVRMSGDSVRAEEPRDPTSPMGFFEAEQHTGLCVEDCDLVKYEGLRFEWPVEYVELAGKGHWFQGVMTTPQLKTFYENHLKECPEIPGLPLRFSIRFPGSGVMGSRGGIEVDQVLSPDQYGEIEVLREDENSIWRIKTSNIRRFHISVSDMRTPVPERLIIDGEICHFPLKSRSDEKKHSFLRSRGVWQIVGDDWRDVSERYGRQRGGLSAMLLTRDRFTILSTGNNTHGIAAQVSRNLFQYYGADSVILKEDTEGPPLIPEGKGNVITIVFGSHVALSELHGHPIRVEADQLTVSQGQAQGQKYVDTHFRFDTGLGAAFLRPLPNERLELVIWGADDLGLQQAARMLPTLTGAGQPDFVIMSRSCMWKGLSGVLAMGFFDSSWKVSEGSYIR